MVSLSRLTTVLTTPSLKPTLNFPSWLPPAEGKNKKEQGGKILHRGRSRDSHVHKQTHAHRRYEKNHPLAKSIILVDVCSFDSTRLFGQESPGTKDLLSPGESEIMSVVFESTSL